MRKFLLFANQLFLNNRTYLSKNFSSPVNTIYKNYTTHSNNYLKLTSTNFKDWQNKWQSMFWEIKPEYPHLNFDRFPESQPEDRGKFFKQDKNLNSSVTLALPHEVYDSNLWIFPGVLSSSRNLMSKVIKYMQSSLDIFQQHDKIKGQTKPLILCPFAPNKKRYNDAMQYGAQKDSFFTPEIKAFTSKYVIPRLLNKQKTSILTHSVGGREVLMIENAARQILIHERNYSSSDVKELFQCFKGVLIGHAMDYSDLPSPRFNKKIILSASDQGVLIPQSLFDVIYTESNCNRPYTIFNFNEYEEIIFLGHQSSVEYINNISNHNGHQLPHYIESLKKYLPPHLRQNISETIFYGSNNLNNTPKAIINSSSNIWQERIKNSSSINLYHTK